MHGQQQNRKSNNYLKIQVPGDKSSTRNLFHISTETATKKNPNKEKTKK